MSIPADPFAVRTHDRSALPTVTDRKPADFGTFRGDGTLGFSDTWIASHNGVFGTARSILRSYDEHYGFLSPANLGPVKPDQPVDLTVENLRVIGAPTASQSEQLSHRLALRTLIGHIARYGHDEAKSPHFLPDDIILATAAQLGVGGRFRRRSGMSRQARRLGRLLQRGSKEAAVQQVMREFQVGRATIFNNQRSSPAYEEIMSLRHDTRPRASDAWFDAGIEDQVAQKLIDEMRATIPPSPEVNWDLICLLEGYYWRARPVSATMLVAIDIALELVDRNGLAKTVSLAGVVDRVVFMALAAREAEQASALSVKDAIEFIESEYGETGEDRLPPTTAARWLELPIYATTVIHMRKMQASLAYTSTAG